MAAIHNFDETLSTIYQRSAKIGIDLRGDVKSGAIKITQLDPAELSPGQFISQVRAAVEDGARFIVIDSLNGFLAAMSGEHMLIAQMHELLTFLNERGVVTFLVLTISGMLGPNMSMPVDMSYLSDNILVLRFFEAGGRLRKAVSVVKKRSGKHEDTIRELSFSPNGIVIGEPLSAFRGVMTGVPVDVGPSPPPEGPPMNQSKTERVLVHAPYGRDAALICRVLERADIPASVCATVEDLCSDLGDEVEAAIISENLSPITASPLWRCTGCAAALVRSSAHRHHQRRRCNRSVAAGV